MTIEKIGKIKNHRLFQNFLWPDELGCFGEKNLIYGWNGSGKTTLSNLFRAIEKAKAFAEGEFEILASGKNISSKELGSSSELPQVRVFNRDFVEENVFTISGDITPIFFLGSDSVEKQKQIAELSKELNKDSEQLKTLRDDKDGLEKEFEKLKTNTSKTIKDLLSGGSGNTYASYDKRNFMIKYNSLKQLSASEQLGKIQSPDAFEKSKLRLQAVQLETLPLVAIDILGVERLVKDVSELSQQRVVAQVIDKLKDDARLADWVKSGLQIHLREESEICLFCGGVLSPERIKQLEGHFSDTLNTLTLALGVQIAKTESFISSLESVKLPHPNSLYGHLKEDFNNRSAEFAVFQQGVIELLRALQKTLNDKLDRPFEVFQPVIPAIDLVVGPVVSLNKVLDDHNKGTVDFNAGKVLARQEIEESKVMESFDDCQRIESQISLADAEIARTEKRINQLKTSIADKEREIIEHRRPAAELTSDLQAYLGRSELSIAAKDNGYHLLRDSIPAKNLSEGEKTAVAFLYFLKSLTDRSFGINNGIVVIDDPVSSLDSAALFYAFGFLKEKTKNAGQLFILTHNFPLLRQVVNWFEILKTKKRKIGYFMLTGEVREGGRTARISMLDDLLRSYHSEYHYLFAKVI
jgi:wobble nucleotide-excising tRNase